MRAGQVAQVAPVAQAEQVELAIFLQLVKPIMPLNATQSNAPIYLIACYSLDELLV